MSKPTDRPRRRRRLRRTTAAWALGLGLSTARLAAAQEFAEPPTFTLEADPYDRGPVGVPFDPPIARPAPVVIEAEPYNDQASPDPTPLDPVATARRGPLFFLKKIRSWPWRRAQGKMLGYPEEFKPRPLGASVHAMGRTMTANGAEARLALHNYDFLPGSAELSERGRDQLAKAAAQLAASPYPLIVERTPDDPALAVARRQSVVEALAAASFPIGEDRVLVGQPLPFGMSGVNAQIVSANALNRTQQYGPPIPINANGVNSPSGVTNQMVGVVPGQ